MSKPYSFTCGPFTGLTSPGPANATEFDAMGGDGSCVSDAVKNVIYRSHLPQTVYPIIEKAFKDVLGVTPRVNEEATQKARDKAKAGAKVDAVYETIPSFATREFELASDDQKKALTVAVSEAVAAASIDCSPARREGGPGKDNLEIAQKALDAGSDKTEKVVAAIASLVPGFDPERDENGIPVLESLARGIKLWRAAQANSLLS